MRTRYSLRFILTAALLVTPLLSTSSAMQGKKSKQLPLTPGPLAVLSPLATDATLLNNLIAVDYQETSDSVVVSVHYKDGQPNGFVRVSRLGAITQFSSANGFPEEVYIAVAPSQNCSGTGLSLGGFHVGDVFAGSGNGTIGRISADGTVVQNVFATLPGETGQEWGGLYFDRTGIFGGDLLVSTTTGGIYRVNSSGVATLVARHPSNAAVEGIISLPNDSRFGPLAGKILVGGTDIGIPSTGETNVLAVDPIDAMHPMGTFTTYSVPDVIEPEGFWIVPAGGDFFGTDFMTQTVVTAPAAGFAGIVGDLVIAAEGEIDPLNKTGKLWDVVWDPVNNKLKTTEILGGRVFQYEGMTFSCTAGGGCVPSTLTCPASTCVAGTGPTVVTFTAPVTTGGTNPGSPATCVPPSGSAFPLGTTPVNCTATDGCGGTASCGFSVTVAGAVITIVDISGNGSATLDTATGAFTFTCSNGFTESGTGTVIIQGGMIALVEDCAQIHIDCASGRAEAAVKSPMGTLRCTIRARNVVCNICR